MTSGGRVRTRRALSRRITSSRRGSSPPARSRACGDGSTSSRRTTRPSALETTLCATTTTSPSSSFTAAAIRAATSSPSPTSGSPWTGITRSSPRKLCNRLLLVGNAGQLEPGVNPVPLVDVQDHRGHRLECTRIRERAGVEGPAVDELPGQLEGRLLGPRIVSGDQRVLIGHLVRGEPDCREGLQTRSDGRLDRFGELLGERALVPPRQDAALGEKEVAGDAKHGRLADRLRQLSGGVEGRVRPDRENDEVGVLDDLLVAAAAHPELDGALPPPLLVARANCDVELEVS